MLLHLRQEADTLHSTGQDLDSLATLYYDGDLNIDSKSPGDLTQVPGIFQKITSHGDSHENDIASSWFGRDKSLLHRQRPNSEA